MDTQQKLILTIENEIMELIDTQEEYTRGDLQGRAMAIAMNAIRKGQEVISRSKWEEVGFNNDWGLMR